MVKGVREREKSDEEDSLLALILSDIGGYSVRNKHKNGAVQSCTTPFFSVLKETLYFRQKRDVMSSNVPSVHRRSIR